MNARNAVWSAILVAGGATMGLVLLCIAPFVAVATLAMRTLPRRFAIGAIVALWFVNEAVGFGWLHYPRTPSTFAWGFAILVASLAAGAAATRIRDTAYAFLSAFVAFELVLAAWSLVVGERPSISARVLAQAFAGNVFGVAVLGALRLAMVATVFPSGAPERRALR